MAAPGANGNSTGQLRIGLTGGIASGKTTVANLLAELGADVIDTDLIARDVVAPGQPGLASVVEAFGAAVRAADGSLDRAAMRKIVFADAGRRRQLESILHPLIAAEMLARAARSTRAYVVFVVPLLVESGMDRLVDRVLVVDCPVETQRIRLRQRDGDSAIQAQRILDAQADRNTRLKSADDVIVNDGDLAGLTVAVRRQHDRYMTLAETENSNSRCRERSRE